MINKKKSSSSKFSPLLLVFLSLFLTGCSYSDEAVSNSKNSVDNSDDIGIDQEASIATIVIDESRCSGCGKCFRFDPEHFAFDAVSRKAKVISQNNTDSISLKTAISACRDRAISLKY